MDVEGDGDLRMEIIAQLIVYNGRSALFCFSLVKQFFLPRAVKITRGRALR